MFFVTVFDAAWYRNCERFIRVRKKEDDPYEHLSSSCTFGYFETKQQALNAVLSSGDCLHEMLYQYLVIEEIGPGIHPIPAKWDGSNQLWFEWNEPLNKWDAIEKPPATKHIILFALG